MLKADVIDYFGGVGSVAKALNITSNAVSQWDETVPLLRQYQLERVTGGKLKADTTKANLQRADAKRA